MSERASPTCKDGSKGPPEPERRDHLDTIRLTTAQALVRFLAQQYVERDGREQRFFAGCFGIFGHGNVAGIGQALAAACRELRYYQARNEQAMVHAAAAFARQNEPARRRFACTSSIGPGATNMVTGAATATINRLPVLLLPGDLFAARASRPGPAAARGAARRRTSRSTTASSPSRATGTASTAPSSSSPRCPQPMRVLTNPAETGAVTLALPQDVQAEAFDFPRSSSRSASGTIAAPRRPTQRCSQRAAGLIRASAKRPLIVAGGGVIYSEATEALRALRRRDRHPRRRDAGRQGHAALRPSAAPRAPIGVTGTLGRQPRCAREADLVIGVGTRLTRLHDRLEDRLPAPRRALHQRQRRGASTRTSTPACRSSATRGDARELSQGCSPATRSRRRTASRSSAAARGVGRGGRAALRARARAVCRPERGHRRGQRVLRAATTSWSAPPAACPATCTSSGGRATRRATTSSTATRAWATRSPAAWA